MDVIGNILASAANTQQAKTADINVAKEGIDKMLCELRNHGVSMRWRWSSNYGLNNDEHNSYYDGDDQTATGQNVRIDFLASPPFVSISDECKKDEFQAVAQARGILDKFSLLSSLTLDLKQVVEMDPSNAMVHPVFLAVGASRNDIDKFPECAKPAGLKRDDFLNPDTGYFHDYYQQAPSIELDNGEIPPEFIGDVTRMIVAGAETGATIITQRPDLREVLAFANGS